MRSGWHEFLQLPAVVFRDSVESSMLSFILSATMELLVTLAVDVTASHRSPSSLRAADGCYCENCDLFRLYYPAKSFLDDDYRSSSRRVAQCQIGVGFIGVQALASWFAFFGRRCGEDGSGCRMLTFTRCLSVFVSFRHGLVYWQL